MAVCTFCQFIITGPGADSASPGDMKLLNLPAPFFLDCSNSITFKVAAIHKLAT